MKGVFKMVTCDHCGRYTDERQLKFTCKKFVCLNCADIVEDEALQNAIELLMDNDKNGTWDEIETIEELIEAITETLKDYETSEETYQFYQTILSDLNELLK